jgi:CheY-specific phosphatase CheX
MSTLSPEVAAAFTSATITALQELAQVEAFADASLADPTATFEGAAVWAMIRLPRSDPGSMSLIVSAQTAASLAARYLPVGTVLTEQLIDDVVGEFANVIAGQAKTALKGTPYHFYLSVPVVARGTNAPDVSALNKPNLTVHLTSDLGLILVMADLPP